MQDSSTERLKLRSRVPPGQFVTEKFPVLTYGPVPSFDPATWTFRTSGLVEVPLELWHKDFLALPRVRVVADVHCVTRWSRLNNHWEGVSAREILQRTRPMPQCRLVMVHCDGGYTTNLPLATLASEDALLAFRHDGADLTPEHGWPLRLVVPQRYAWKSAKWVRGLEFIEQDKPGFWESLGYHNDADPWKEERFAE